MTDDTDALQRALLDWQGSRRATHGGETRELPREGTPSLTLFRSETK